MNKNKNRIYFSGFASGISDKNVYDHELIIADLLNHLYTRKGERLMNPNFGSIVWDLLFQPMTEGVRFEIQDDISRIIESDPRLVLQNISVTQIENGYNVLVTLFFKNLGIVKTLDVNLNDRTYVIRD